MFKSLIKKIYDCAINRMLFVYLATALALGISIDWKTALNTTNLATLNRLRPDMFEGLVHLINKDGSFDHKVLDEYTLYYQKVIQVLPTLADAKGLYAYCLYYGGRQQQAIEMYQKAIVTNPSFFWFYYNLGVIDYKKGDFAAAQHYFEIAITKRPQDAMVFVSSSQRLYLPLILLEAPSQDVEGFLKNQFEEGYTLAYMLLIDSVYQQKHYDKTVGFSYLALKSPLKNKVFFNYYAGVGAYQLGKYKESISLLQAAIQEDPKFAKAYEYLAANLKALGEEGPAVEVLKQAKLLQQAGMASDPVKLENLRLTLY